MTVKFSDDEFILIKNLLFIYEQGQKTMLTKLDIINEDFKHFHSDNPIEYIKGRIKTPESIAAKLHKLNLDITADNAGQRIKDIAGIRIICSFAKDIYYLADILKSLPDVKIINEKDYVSRPKPSGYRSFHLTLEIPVYYSGKTEKVPIEVQIRTAAMDFWATLEHKVRYKYNEHIPQHLCDELTVCADKIAELDNRMFLIHDILSLINQT
jgi:putative GTP pyrophosphokinase